MRRSFKFLLRPTRRQFGALATMLADHCSLYNAALQERRDAYRHPSRTAIRYGHQSAQLKDIHAADPTGQGHWSFSSQQATLRRLDKAYSAFFRRVKSGSTPGYPRFRRASWFDTVDFPRDGDGVRWNATPQDGVTRVRLLGIGNVRVHQHRPVGGRVKTVSVKREGRRWYVVLGCDDVPAERLAAAQRMVARCQRRSVRRAKAVRRVGALHRAIRRRRRDHAHKAALELVRRFDVIAHERPRIANLVRQPRPRPDPARPGNFLTQRRARPG